MYIRIRVGAALLTCALTAMALGQAAAQEKVRDVTVRGKIVKLEAPDRFVVQTTDNREVVLVANPQTRYLINGKTSRYADLRVGAEINAAYVVSDERNLVNSVTVGVASDVPQAEGLIIRGKIARVKETEVVVRSADGKEFVLVTAPKTRILRKGKVATTTELRVGTEVSATYVEREGALRAETITIGPAAVDPASPASDATVVEGTVVRVVGDDQVVVRAANKKEVIVYVNPTTKYLFEDQPGRFTDIRSGSDIRIEYDVRDRRNLARSIIGVRRNKK